MAEVDTSSYPRAPALPAQKSFLDQAQQYQQLDQGNVNLQRSGIALSQDKLKYYNDQHKIVMDDLSAYANDPNSTPQEVANAMERRLKAMDAQPAVIDQMRQTFSNLPNAPLGKNGAGNPEFSRRLDLISRQGQDANSRANRLYGANVTMDDGANVTPGRVYERGGPVPTGYPIQKQAPPTQAEFDENNNPRYRGSQNPELPAGAQPVEGGFPGQYRPAGGGLPVANGQTPIPQPRPALPVAGKPNMNLTGGGNAVTGVDTQNIPTDVSPANFAQRYQGPSGGKSGADPMFTEGKDAYARAQLVAGAKAQALKPLIQAIPLMQTPGFLSGPLTDQFTKAVAALKSTGIINIADNADPTAIRQEAVKKLYQYLSNSPAAQRSDSAQTLKEAGSPNPNVQILPALIKLAKDQVALDRIEIAMPNAFKGKDLQNFSKHVGTFPQSVDERAFVLDQDPPEKSKALVDKMVAQRLSKNNRERVEAEKFLRSLDIADEQGFYN